MRAKTDSMDEVVRGREFEGFASLGGVDHSFENIDLPVFQLPTHFAPGAEPNLDFHPHDLGNRPGQVHIVTGGVTLAVEELIGGIIVVAADDDQGVFFERSALGGSRSDRPEQETCHSRSQEKAQDKGPGGRRCQAESHLETGCCRGG